MLGFLTFLQNFHRKRLLILQQIIISIVLRGHIAPHERRKSIYFQCILGVCTWVGDNVIGDY